MVKSKSRKIIEEMIKDIQSHKRNKEDLLPIYVSERINKQVQSYYKEIMDNYNTLAHQENEIKVVKKLSKC